jgi:N-acetyl-anhydromuramyl-L-alanine amidase AmpD
MRFYPKAYAYKEIIENGESLFKPEGITIHYSAGSSAESSIEFLRTTKLRYHFLIARVGMIYQMVVLDGRVNHAGKAEWNTLSPNESHIAICIANWGLLKKKGTEYRTWAKKTLDTSQVAYRAGRNGKYEYWEKATDKQESSLVDLVYWLCKNHKIKPENICGHDEATSRKIDPGGALSFSMERLRNTACSFL